MIPGDRVNENLRKHQKLQSGDYTALALAGDRAYAREPTRKRNNTEAEGSRYALELRQVIIEEPSELPCQSAGYPHIQSFDPVIRSLKRSL